MGQAIAERWGVPETVSVDGIGEMPTIDAVKSNDLLASLRTAYAGDADALRGIDAMRFVVELQARATELLLEHQQATTIEAQREEFQQTGYAYDLLPSAVEPGMPRQVEMLVEAKAQLVGAQAMVAEYTQVEGQPFDCQKAAMLQNANRHLLNAQTEFMRLADLFANNPEHLSIVMDYLTERAAAADGPAPEIIPTLTPQAAVAAP